MLTEFFKNMKVTYILLIFTTIFSCSPRIIDSKNNNLEFSIDNKKIIIIDILSDSKFIDREIPTKISIKGEKIEVENLSYSSYLGFKLVDKDYDKNIIIIEINPKIGQVKTEQFELNISYVENNKTITHKFLIPWKN